MITGTPVRSKRRIKLYAVGQGALDLFNKCLHEEAQKHISKMESQKQIAAEEVATAETKIQYPAGATARSIRRGTCWKISSTKNRPAPSNLQPGKKRRK